MKYVLGAECCRSLCLLGQDKLARLGHAPSTVHLRWLNLEIADGMTFQALPLGMNHLLPIVSARPSRQCHREVFKRRHGGSPNSQTTIYSSSLAIKIH